MTESVGVGDASVPRRGDAPSRQPDHPDPSRVVVRLTVPAPPATPPPAPGLGRGVPIRRTRRRCLAAWALLGAGAALSGVVAVVMLGAWSEVLVARAVANQSFSPMVTIGGGHGLFLLTASFLVLIASMSKVWALGAFLGGHRETATVLVAMVVLDLAVVAVSALGGGVAFAGCLAVVVLDVGVAVTLGLPSRRRRRTLRG